MTSKSDKVLVERLTVDEAANEIAESVFITIEQLQGPELSWQLDKGELVKKYRVLIARTGLDSKARITKLEGALRATNAFLHNSRHTDGLGTAGEARFKKNKALLRGEERFANDLLDRWREEDEKEPNHE